MEGLKTNVEHDLPVQGMKHQNVAGMGSSIISPSPDKFERFEKWLIENGAQFDMVELREYGSEDANNGAFETEHAILRRNAETIMEEEEDKKEETCVSSYAMNSQCANDEDCEMRGVHAKQTILPNTTCISIPLSCLITVEMGQATQIGQAILSSELDLDAPKHVFLMIYLLLDRRNPKSFFQPYYDILPKTLNNMPIFWDEEHLKYLEGSYLLQQIYDRNKAIQEDYELICEIAPQLKEIATLDEFKWARMCVCSRNFGLIINGVRTSALVPHADMLNHFRPRQTKWTFDNEKQAFTITSLQSIPSGAQVFDSYGQKCNHRFLLNYGFAIEDNTELDGYCPNEVSLKLSPALVNEVARDRNMQPLSLSFQLMKAEFWCRDSAAAAVLSVGSLNISSGKSLGLDDLISSPSYTKRIRVNVSNNENTKAMMSMLRVIVADEDELAVISCGGLYMHRTCKDVRFAICIRNERAALLLLLHVVLKALAAYPTSLAEDKLALQSMEALPPFSNIRHATIQVRGEKEVLFHYKNLAEIGLSVIDLPEAEFEASIRALQESAHYSILHYCADVLGSIRRDSIRKVAM